jgi:hypothetical protein
MKYFIILALLGSLSSCTNLLKINKKNKSSGSSTLSGNVSSFWSDFGIASANAQDEMMLERRWCCALPLILTPEEIRTALHNSTSIQALYTDFISNSNSTTFTDIVQDTINKAIDSESGLNEVVNFSPDIAELTPSDFPHGLAIAVGFNEENKIVSTLLSPLSESGSYAFSDSKEKDVVFYKMSFIFEKNNELQYRQSFVFTDGSSAKQDVDYFSSSASMKVSLDLAQDPSLNYLLLEDQLVSYAEEVKGSNVENNKQTSADLMLSLNYSDYGSITPVQKTILKSLIAHNMITDTVFSSAITESAEAINSESEITDQTKKDLYATKLDSGVTNLIDQLISSNILPARTAVVVVVVREDRIVVMEEM